MNSTKEFEKIIDSIYGVYLDSTTGFGLLRSWFKDHQATALNILKSSHSEMMSIEHLDTITFNYGQGDPNETGSKVLHSCTQKEYKERNQVGGLNFKFLGNMALVSIYQYWEDFHRSHIAEELSIIKNDLQYPIMGDIRLLRISILHHGGIALKQVEKCSLLTWYKEGDVIAIDSQKFETIIYHTKAMLKSIEDKYDQLNAENCSL